MFRRTAVRVAVVFCALLGFSAAAECALIVGYSGDSSGAMTADSGVTGENLTRVGVDPAGGSNYATNNWSTGALDSGKYLEFGFTATTYQFGIDLTSMEIQYGRGGNGPTQLEIQISINGGAFQPLFSDPDVGLTATGPEHPTINLSSYDHVTSAVFRLYGYNAQNAPGQLDFKNFTGANGTYAITITGLAATPEPGSLAVFGLGAVAAGYVGWRRRKATAAQKA